MARRRWKVEDIRSVLEDENPFKQWGYVPSIQKKEIGDRWVDARGQMWEQKNGYKISVNEKADQIRDLIRQHCSKCNMDIRWGGRLDHQFFKKSGMCYNCTIDHDTMLKISGKWDAYEKKKVWSYQLSFLKDIRKYIQDSIQYLETTDGKMHFVDEMGGIETWTNTQIDDLLIGARSDLERVNKDIEEIDGWISALGPVEEIDAK